MIENARDSMDGTRTAAEREADGGRSARAAGFRSFEETVIHDAALVAAARRAGAEKRVEELKADAVRAVRVRNFQAASAAVRSAWRACGLPDPRDTTPPGRPDQN